MCVGQLRSPAYITHEASPDVHRRLGLIMPKQFLQDSWSRALDQLEELRQGLDADNFLQTWPPDAIRTRIMKVFQPEAIAPALISENIPYCDRISKSSTDAQPHLTRTQSHQDTCKI